MSTHRKSGWLGTPLLVLRVCLAGALIAAAMQAAFTAVLSGTGLVKEFGPVSSNWSLVLSFPFQYVLEVGKATVLLCPITIVNYGTFGLAAGATSAALLYFRRRRACSSWRLSAECAVVGLILGQFFPSACGYRTGLDMLLSWICGITCVFVCAVGFRKRFRALATQVR